MDPAPGGTQPHSRRDPRPAQGVIPRAGERMVPGTAQGLPARSPAGAGFEDARLLRSARARSHGRRPRRRTPKPRETAMGAAQPRNLASAIRLSPALGWRLNRLRCMTPAEIGHRVVKAAAMRAERWGFVRCVVPAADLSRTARPWIHADGRLDPLPYARVAERIAAGRLDVFALEDAPLGRPPRWNRDPKTGIEAPLSFGKQLDYRDPKIVGDIKYLWEPNRHLQFVTLAQAYALTAERRYGEAVREQLEGWFTACPFRMGANWSSALEAGIRLLNWSLAWQLVGGLESELFAGDAGKAFRDRW